MKMRLFLILAWMALAIQTDFIYAAQGQVTKKSSTKSASSKTPPNLPENAPQLSTYDAARQYRLNYLRPLFCTVIFVNPAGGEPFRLGGSERDEKSPAHQKANMDSVSMPKEDAASMEDESFNYSLRRGKTVFNIHLKDGRVLSEFAFLNASARGTFSLYTSPTKIPSDSKQWKMAFNGVPFEDKKMFVKKFAPVEGQYIKIEFQTESNGKIAALKLYGSDYQLGFGLKKKSDLQQAAPTQDGEDPQTKTAPETNSETKPETVCMDVAGLHTNSRVIFATSGTEFGDANQVLSDSPEAGYLFGSFDRNPAMTVDFMETRELERMSIRMSAPEGELNIYTFDKLPGVEAIPPKPEAAVWYIPRQESVAGWMPISWNPRLFKKIQMGDDAPNLPPKGDAFWKWLKPISTLIVEKAGSHMRYAPVIEHGKGRFMTLRWSFADKDKADKRSPQPFVIHRIQAFAQVPVELAEPILCDIVQLTEPAPNLKAGISGKSGEGSAFKDHEKILLAGECMTIDDAGNLVIVQMADLPPHVAESIGQSLSESVEQSLTATVNDVVQAPLADGVSNQLLGEPVAPPMPMEIPDSSRDGNGGNSSDSSPPDVPVASP